MKVLKNTAASQTFEATSTGLQPKDRIHFRESGEKQGATAEVEFVDGLTVTLVQHRTLRAGWEVVLEMGPG